MNKLLTEALEENVSLYFNFFVTLNVFIFT